MNLNKLFKLSGDASFRHFYRSRNSIIVYCVKNKKSNLLDYDAINKILIKKKVIAPSLISQHYKENYIEIEDFGDLTVFEKFKKKTTNKKNYYKKILDLLSKIKKIKIKNQKTFLKTNFKVPNYTSKMLLDESNLFIDWYLQKYFKGKKKQSIEKELKIIFKKLLRNISYNKKVFVHRDFHISNIMITKRGLGLIDSQDAVYGNIAYDLASLIDDVRLKTNTKVKDFIFNEFLKKNKNLDHKKFKNDFDILSVLRNFKIIGIFTRLSMRDNKNKYLKLIPYAWKLIELRTSKNPIFKDLNYLLIKNFDKKKRK
ncbi:phosphotransferase [Candidatus Pelagibacter sp.]|nr:phosphotransferase [Candidatus Pelagibacter sp.]